MRLDLAAGTLEAGGAGDDTLEGDPDEADFYAEYDYAPGDDVYAGGDGDDLLHDHAGGRDRMDGGRGDDALLLQIYGPPDDDTDPRSTSGVLRGGSGDDLLSGGVGTDRLAGGPGRDKLDGAAGRDRVDGGSGNDRIGAPSSGPTGATGSGAASGAQAGACPNDRISVGLGSRVNQKLEKLLLDAPYAGYRPAMRKPLLLACFLSLLLPAGASAATARIIKLDSCGGNATCQNSEAGVPLSVVDVNEEPADASANKMTIRPEGDDVVLQDAGAPLAAGEGCTAVDPATVRCPLRQNALDSGVFVLQAGLGDGDDSLDVDGDLGGRVSLDGGKGKDQITGGNESDVLVGGPGVDKLDGRGGDDAMSFATTKTPVIVDLKKGEATVKGQTDKVTSVETVTGGKDDDVLIGSDEDDVLDGSLGDDRMEGGDGNDALSGDGGGDMIEGGAGNDEITGDPVNELDEGFAPTGSDELRGGSGKDVIRDGGRAKGDVMVGGKGNDRLQAGFGATNLRGGAGKDRLTGSPKGDKLDGGKGNDRIDGAAGNDEIIGGKGKDTIKGGKGKDRVDIQDFQADFMGDVEIGRDKVKGDRFDKFNKA
ncbi:MAG TPA: calcium-binding protein [Solirubrobacteraceae bacterium]